MSLVISINSETIPSEDIRKYPSINDMLSFNNSDLMPSSISLVLDNTDKSDYDPHAVGSMFYAINYYGKPVDIYDDVLEIYLFKGLIRKIKSSDKDATLTIEISNYFQNLTAICDYQNTGSDLTPAETIYNILIDPDMGSMPEDAINQRSFQRAINIQDAAGAYVYVNYDIKKNKSCNDVINELLRISLCHLYVVDGQIYMYQWQEWAGQIGDSIDDDSLIEKSFGYEDEPKDIYNYYNIAYKNGAAVAYSTGSDDGSIDVFGRIVFNVPDEKMDSTASADFDILYKDATSASWAGELALSRYSSMKQNFSFTADYESRFLKLGDQIDLLCGDYNNEPGRIMEIKIDNEKKIIGIKGEFLNIPHEYYDRDEDAPLAPEITLAVARRNSIVIKWTINEDSDYLGYKIFFTSTLGEWKSEYCNMGISPIDQKTLSTTPDGLNYYEIFDMNEGTTYHVKITCYDTSFNVSGFSNRMTATCFSDNDENKYCVTGDFLTTGISLDGTNPEGGTQIGTEEASYTSDIFCNPAGWSSLRWRAYAIPTNPTTGMLIGYEVREGDDYTSLGDWSGMADACGDITYTLSGYKYFQIRFIFFPETIATDTDLVYLKRAD